MKRIIEGKRYDTATAEEIASDGYGYAGDFRHWWERLYRTAAGGWFLVGEGGPLSRYGESVAQNEWSGGSKLIPLTAEQARAWCEEHEATAALERYFAGQVVDA
jgi:hypothetical protein